MTIKKTGMTGLVVTVQELGTVIVDWISIQRFDVVDLD
jgi:hypothetical protein